MSSMQPSNGFGFLDGNSIMKMNNLAVGYFPGEQSEIGIYPPPPIPSYPVQQPTTGQLMLVALVAEPQQQEAQPHSGTSF
jgi:hypothetical protein